MGERAWQAQSEDGTALEERDLLLACWHAAEHNEHAWVVEQLSSWPVERLVATPDMGLRLCFSLSYVGNVAAALALLPELQVACSSAGNSRLFRRHLLAETHVLFRAGRPDEARARALRGITFATRARDQGLTGTFEMVLANVAAFQGMFAEALAGYSRARTIHQRLGRDIGGLCVNVAITYQELGMYDKAAQQLETAFASARRTGIEYDVAMVEREHALVLNATGQSDVAELWARRSLKRFRRLKMERAIADGTRVLGAVARVRQRPMSARRYLVKAVELARACDAVQMEAESLEEMAALERDLGNTQAAVDAASAAARIYIAAGSGFRAQRALASMCSAATPVSFPAGKAGPAGLGDSSRTPSRTRPSTRQSARGQ